MITGSAKPNLTITIIIVADTLNESTTDHTGMKTDMAAEILQGPALSLSAQLRKRTTPQQARDIGICLNCGNTALYPTCDTHCDRCGVKTGEVNDGQ